MTHCCTHADVCGHEQVKDYLTVSRTVSLRGLARNCKVCDQLSTNGGPPLSQCSASILAAARRLSGTTPNANLADW